jgi:hypothetical protein
MLKEQRRVRALGWGMKRKVGTALSCIATLILLVEWSWAGPVDLCQSQRKGYLKQDSLIKDRTNIYEEKGNQKGYLKPDSLVNERTNVYSD